MTIALKGGARRLRVAAFAFVVVFGLAVLIIGMVVRNRMQPTGEPAATDAYQSSPAEAVQAPVRFPPVIPEDAEVHFYVGQVVRIDESGGGFVLETSRGQKHVLVTSATDLQEELLPPAEERRKAAEEDTILSASVRAFAGPILVGATVRVMSVENISGLAEFTANKVVILHES